MRRPLNWQCRDSRDLNGRSGPELGDFHLGAKINLRQQIVQCGVAAACLAFQHRRFETPKSRRVDLPTQQRQLEFLQGIEQTVSTFCRAPALFCRLLEGLQGDQSVDAGDAARQGGGRCRQRGRTRIKAKATAIRPDRRTSGCEAKAVGSLYTHCGVLKPLRITLDPHG